MAYLKVLSRHSSKIMATRNISQYSCRDSKPIPSELKCKAFPLLVSVGSRLHREVVVRSKIHPLVFPCFFILVPYSLHDSHTCNFFVSLS